MGRKRIVNSVLKISLVSIIAIFAQCASSQKMEKKIDTDAPVTLKSPYFEKWVSGIREGGAGFIIYIPIESDDTVKLEEAYFRGKKIPLRKNKGGDIYMGKYTDPNSIEKIELVMSSDPKEEFKNKVPVIEKKIPFALSANECVITYTKDGEKGHFRIKNLPEKPVQGIPR